MAEWDRSVSDSWTSVNLWLKICEITNRLDLLLLSSSNLFCLSSGGTPLLWVS